MLYHSVAARLVAVDVVVSGGVFVVAAIVVIEPVFASVAVLAVFVFVVVASVLVVDVDLVAFIEIAFGRQQRKKIIF